MSESPLVQFKFNIPLALKERLADAAERSGRSLSSEIITRLEASLSLGDEGIDLTFDGITNLIQDMILSETMPLSDRIREIESELTAMRRYP